MNASEQETGGAAGGSGVRELSQPGRSRLLDIIAAAVSLVGLADAIYLTAEHLAGSHVRCTIVTGCNEVLGSPYATIGGVPVAAFGAVAYFTVFSLAILSAFGYAAARPLLAATVALMFAATLWFLYVQAFILKHFCSYCLLSAIVTFTLSGIVLAGRFHRLNKNH